MEERYELSLNRIKSISEDKILPGKTLRFFEKVAEFILLVTKVLELKEKDELCKLTLSELRSLNHDLYASYGVEDMLFDIPDLSADTISSLRVILAELFAMIPYAYEGDKLMVLIRMELFLECYTSVYLGTKENEDPADELKHILYYYVSDYTHLATKKKLKAMLDPDDDLIYSIVTKGDLGDLRTLYLYGEYVTKNEEKLFLYLASLPDGTLRKMADTFTEGFRIGFLVTNKDITKKKTVNIRYNIGFEAVIRLAVENFEKMGLKSIMPRGRSNLLDQRTMYKAGVIGANVSRQHDFEHKDDQALFLDSRLITIRLEALEKYYEELKDKAKLYAGPAVMEVFGEKAPELKNAPHAPRLTKKQEKLLSGYKVKALDITGRYILEEERSFTIISFPTPHIGADFEKIFDEVIKLNTLDYDLYRDVQQKMIDALDLAKYVIVKGSEDNRTDIKVSLHKLSDPEHETNFENCVADVNIPVGEVFTSPVLKGTNGILHVKKVFLNGLEYKDIMLTISDGMVTDYCCKNFDDEDENRSYIKDNVLFHHESLPVGEFAIGTNTTAYVMARRFKIEDVLPILIAEKTGPHFAFGDTCYSQAEDVRVYNPDKKEIIARDNEVSALRDTDPLKAYFGCHTDITIPYDELSLISAVTPGGENIDIIKDGRFVLPGTEILNEPFRNC